MAGLTVMEVSATLLTVNVVDAEMEPEAAEMLELPADTLVTSPELLGTLPIVATEPTDELHWTDPVIFCTLPSLKEPVATNCSVVPIGMV